MPRLLAASLRRLNKEFSTYPKPIVDEKATAKRAKAAIAAIRRKKITRQQAAEVYKKHGSRSKVIKRPKFVKTQVPHGRNIITFLQIQATAQARIEAAVPVVATPVASKYLGSFGKREEEGIADGSTLSPKQSRLFHYSSRKKSIPTTEAPETKQCSISNKGQQQLTLKEAFARSETNNEPWACRTCTFLNQKPNGLVCEMCQTKR